MIHDTLSYLPERKKNKDSPSGNVDGKKCVHLFLPHFFSIRGTFLRIVAITNIGLPKDGVWTSTMVSSKVEGSST